MLPGGRAAPAPLGIYPVPTIDAGVAIEVILAVDIDVDIVAAPAPAAAAPDCSADHHTSAKGHKAGAWRVRAVPVGVIPG